MFPGTLSLPAQNALAVLSQSGILAQAYMAGGSALALQLGHRQSVDFDFFSPVEFEPQTIADQLKTKGEFTLDQLTPKTVLGTFGGVRLSLFHYTYALIDKTTPYEGIALAGPKDIAAMKLVAITDRGSKKDFIDLYMLAKLRFALAEMLTFYEQKYHLLTENKLIILKSLQYFDDAETMEMPVMLSSIDWDEVKKFFVQEVKQLWK
ncbi:hypothetical protein A2Z00_02785 [Candidatus Gottesmanbacteria bacterium RBG_13_45_10]|uniref:Nucleotidyl transferase AbiEii toxin, Type IV TA system n=1 Tax=Candidatus Gottesmanbacteria bacterium RBG_13_45_10 TaxID=1798370 RepID=A0A1F5ZGM6_9BACT|nr:MAG: hypothetical protein A2Z00_02785 [Candidatus Gottesmanbacteria bacterium RBG_13_45_10]